VECRGFGRRKRGNRGNRFKGMPLNLATRGTRVRIECIMGNENIVIRLKEMGLINGKIISIAKNDVGSLILGLDDSRIILARGMASKILVSEI
jgi:Fe2+ transport system protein FeoA